MNAAIEWANGLAAHWARGMWPVLWQTAALAVVVGLIVLSARRMSPALRFWLWMLVPMRLLVMPLIVVSLPVLANPPAAQLQPAVTPPSFASQAPVEAPALDMTAAADVAGGAAFRPSSKARSREHLDVAHGRLGCGRRLLCAPARARLAEDERQLPGRRARTATRASATAPATRRPCSACGICPGS